MNVTLDWLFQNSGKVLAPGQWCKLLDVAVLDADGWKDKSIIEPIGLQEFILRLSECTIFPVDPREVDPR